MHGHGLNCRSFPHMEWSVGASLFLLIAAAACESGNPEAEIPPETPVQLVLDTVNVFHSDQF